MKGLFKKKWVWITVVVIVLVLALMYYIGSNAETESNVTIGESITFNNSSSNDPTRVKIFDDDRFKDLVVIS